MAEKIVKTEHYTTQYIRAVW